MPLIQRLKRDRPRAALRAGTVALGALALALPLATPAGAVEPRSAEQQPQFYSRPDILQAAPTLRTSTTGAVDDGYLLTAPFSAFGATQEEVVETLDDPMFTGPIGPGGAAIYNNSGQLVWWNPSTAMNLDAITFRGQPALSAFEWDSNRVGRWVIRDQNYNQIAQFQMQGFPTDQHEFQISPDGQRALMVGYPIATMNLSQYGGPSNAQVYYNVVQEVDINTGQVTFQWNSLDHVPIDETQEPMSGFLDYLHINSLEYDSDGNLLISGRNTSTVYKVNKQTGQIMWRMGGERSNFTFANSSHNFSYQHDVRRLPDGRISMFDNGNRRVPATSRGAVYDVNESARTATLVEDLRQGNAAAFAMGSNHTTDSGNRLVSYGSAGPIAEFRGTQQVFSASFPTNYWTYRTHRDDWTGTPTRAPDVAWSEPDSDGSRDFYMSWNGATEVDSWHIEAGETEDSLVPLESVDKAGFETAAEVTAPEDADVYVISAVDADGNVLDTRTLTADTPTIGE